MVLRLITILKPLSLCRKINFQLSDQIGIISMTLFDFENNGTNYTFETFGDYVSVMANKCGMDFGEIARIREPYNENPGLILNICFGFSGVIDIIEAWRQYAEKIDECNDQIV